MEYEPLGRNPPLESTRDGVGMSFKDLRNQFAPETSKDIDKARVVLPLKYLTFGSYKVPGILVFPSDINLLGKPPYSQSYIRGKLFPNGTITRFCFCPTIETTIIPMSLGGLVGEFDGLEIKKIRYSLQKQGCEEGHQGLEDELSGYSANVRLDFMVLYAKKWARRFHLNGAVLIDPAHRRLCLDSPTPVCLVGMDFMIKHPHLVFEPRFDRRKELSFKLAKGPFVDRTYKIPKNIWDEIIVYVEGYYSIATGNIGCGIFFEPKSIFNSFCRVSRYGTFDKELDGLWRERGILVGIVKALQIVEALSTEGGINPTSLIIRTSSAEIEGMLAPIKWFSTRVRPPRSQDEVSPDRHLEMVFPPTIRDVAMYYHGNFVKRDPGFRIKYEYVPRPECYSGTLSARLLATAGSKMEEFYIESECEGAENQHLWGHTRSMRANTQDVISLRSHTGVKDRSLYVSFGFDGFFLIQKEKAHKAMEAADMAGLKPNLGNHKGESKGTSGGKRFAILDKLSDSRTNEHRPTGSLDEGIMKSLGRPIERVEEDLQRDILSLGLSEFENDWETPVKSSDTDPSLGQTMSQSYEGVYAEHTTEKRPSNRLGKETVNMVGEKGGESKTRENIKTKGGDLTKVLEMWKIKPKTTKEINHPEGARSGCDADCKCRVRGQCLCKLEKLVCECDKPQSSIGISYHQKSRKANDLANDYRALKLSEAEIFDFDDPGYMVISGSSPGRFGKSEAGGMGEKLICEPSMGLEQLLEHKKRLEGYKKSPLVRGVPQPYLPQSEEANYHRSPEPLQYMEYAMVPKSPEGQKLPKNLELRKYTQVPNVSCCSQNHSKREDKAA